MYKIITAFFCCISILTQPAKAQIQLDSTIVDTATILNGLHVPWEILWGPDNRIWFTERNGHVSAFDPVTLVKKRLLTIPGVTEQSESGLLGMVLHPGFTDTPHVFVVYNYLSTGAIKEKLVRYTWSPDTLKDPLELLNNLNGNFNHNGSRIIIMPDRKMIMSLGDAQTGSNSQDMNSLSGKFLRINLDGSIPSDNPIPGSLVWSSGHRNAQGLVLAPNGNLYSSEHGANSDDELNLLEVNRNFGWPTVAGFCNLPSEITFCAANNVKEPMKAWTPTIATAGIDYFDHPSIPEWRNCLLMTTLKESDLRILQLDPTGYFITGENIYLNNTLGRLRDVCISPGGVIYISTSNQDGRAGTGFPKPGDDRILEIRAHGNTGIKNNSVSELLRIFPNPFDYSLQITTSMQLPAKSELTFYDVTGREIKRLVIQQGETTLLTENWDPGFYFYRIESEGQNEGSGKLIKR